MRLCSFLPPGESSPVAGLVEGDAVRPLADVDVLSVVRGAPTGPPGDPLPLAGVTLLAPLRPPKIIGIGLNFRDHAAETGKEPPPEPLLFAQLATSVTRPRGP